ncbi:MAG: type III pantothenate kinase [Anaerolineae bacterium]
MLLAINVGNTNVHYGLFDGEHLTEHFRVATDHAQTADEYGVTLRYLLRMAGAALPSAPPLPRNALSSRWRDGVHAAVIASVVPPVTATLVEAIRAYVGVEPLVVRYGVRNGLDIQYETPVSLGADRVVDAVAAVALHGAPVITLDFGTATVMNVIAAERAFLGGAILPGVRTAADALSRSAARLTRIDLHVPPSVIGRTTQQSIQSGAIFGYVGMIEGLLGRLRSTLPPDQRHAPVVATGGMVSLIAPLTDAIDFVVPSLALIGLRLIWEMNQP